MLHRGEKAAVRGKPAGSNDFWMRRSSVLLLKKMDFRPWTSELLAGWKLRPQSEAKQNTKSNCRSASSCTWLRLERPKYCG
jgi:hypothetical protein